MSIAIFCDFDGTITQTDVGKALLTKYGGKNWQFYDKLVIRGEIGTREALIKQWGSLRATKEQVQTLIEEIQIDPTFKDFLKWVDEKNWNFTIVSDGFRSYIDKILTNHDINANELKIKANEMDIVNHKAKLDFLTPKCDHDCANCKHSHVNELKNKNYFIIYIGDGLSDILPARELADVIFAKKGEDLAKSLEDNIRTITFENFREIQDYLNDHLDELNRS